MCKKKDAIISALRASGMQENEAIATEVEIGRISLVGCTSYREEATKRMMKIYGEGRIIQAEDVRKLAARLSDVVRIEKNARRASEAVAQRFYTQLWRV